MTLVAAITAVGVASAQAAESPDKLIQQAKDALRVAESDMHNGARDEAATGVQAAAELLFQVREIDPDHSKLPLLIGTAERLRDTLQKRMGKTIVLRTDEGAADPAEGDSLPDDAETLARQAGDLLRQAESDMHNGRNAEAKALLDQAAPVIAKLRAVDPEHPRLMALETALQNQVKTVDSRLAAADDPQAPGDDPETSPTGNPPSSETKLPYHTRNIVRDADQHFASAEHAFGELADEGPGLDDATLHGRIDNRILAIEALLPALEETAATDGVSDDPRVIAIGTRLAELRERLAESRAGTAAREAAASATQGGIDADVAALRSTFDRLNDAYFTKCTGTAIYYNDLDAPRETLALIEKFEKEELAAARTQLEAFTSKYGTTREEVEKKTNDAQAAYPFEGLRDGISNVAKTREAMAEDLIARANDMINGLPSLHDLYRMKGHDSVRSYVTLAAGYSPDNAAVQALRATVDEVLQADLEAYVKNIEGKTWPGTTKSREAKAALQFFQEDIGWGRRDENPRAEDKAPRRPIGIAITGEWSVQARDLLGNPTMYGLPALVAVQLDREKDMGLARVYSVTMRTAESGNPEMKPPFTSITVGDSYFIKASKVK